MMIRKDRYKKIITVKNSIVETLPDEIYPESLNHYIRELSHKDVNMAIAMFVVFSCGTFSDYNDNSGKLAGFMLPATKDCCMLWKYYAKLFRKGKDVPWITL